MKRVLAFQQVVIGSKVLLESQGIKSKHELTNTQTKSVQSGSLIYSISKKKVVGTLVRTFV